MRFNNKKKTLEGNKALYFIVEVSRKHCLFVDIDLFAEFLQFAQDILH